MNAPPPLAAPPPAARAEPPQPPQPGAAPAPSRLQVAAAVTRYRACTVDPRPGRAVHCPDLNACLVNEGRPVAVDCNAVHFGYAIPVSVVPLPHEPELAELVLEPSPDLTPRAVSFLLRHHPQLRPSEPLSAPAADADAAPALAPAPAAPDGLMAAAARPEPLRGRKFAAEPDEDIAAIAKQISDHAEAIYQTWKSRGLAPTEILTCHNNVSAADKFGTALTPSPPAEVRGVAAGRGAGRGQQPRAARKSPGGPEPPSSLELLAQAPSLDANNLEKLVSTFVSEDKARLAAQRQQQQQGQGKALPSSIQFALQKFEKQQSPQAASPVAKGPTSPYGKQPQSPSPVEAKGAQPSKIPTAVGFPSPHHARSPSLTGAPSVKSPATSPSAQFRPAQTASSPVRGDTIETILPPDLDLNAAPAKRAPDGPESPSGLTTWPLKGKAAAGQTAPQQPQPPERQSNGKFATLPANSSASATQENSAYLAEVAREEERLINALKTGIIIAEEKKTPTTTNDKGNILLKKNKEKTSPAKEKTPISVNEAPSPAQPTAAPSSPSAAPAKPATQAPAPELDKSNLSSLSLVDFAKARYRSAQARPLTQQRLEDARQLRGAATASTAGPASAAAAPGSRPQEVVAATRNRFQQPRDGGTAWPEAEAPLRRAALKTVPHPELTSAQRQHLRDAAAAGAQPQPGSNPVRPFLTRGSVAERVLIFEKCPTELLLDNKRAHAHARHEQRAAPALAAWRAPHEVAAKAQTYSRTKDNAWPNALPPNTTLQRHVRTHRNVHIPRFYFPKGKPSTDQQQSEQILQRIVTAFRALPNQQAARDQFHTITKACDCPLYWKVPLFIAAGGEKLGYVEANSFVEFWKNMCSTCHDAAARFFYILSKGHQHDLTTEDFIPLVQDVVDTHPGLTFLKEATEFHSRYVHTVITRIFYCVNRSWSGKISLPELRRSDLLRIIRLLEEEEDINQVTAYFSYEHFYVIYCKFWELDRDHDLYIDRQDLARHSDHALSTRMIDRIFSGAVTRGGRHNEDKMSYTDFVWFLLSEEDKRHPTAIEYWFRCMDLDGDGFLSMYELEYFYEEQLQRMEAIGIETLPFEDCLCQMLDMIHPAQPGKVSLSDLKRCKMTPIFFDTFFNLEKYLDHEQRDPFASQRDHDNDGHELSDWDRYAADEYELLVAEEGGNDQQDDQGFDNNVEDALSPNLDSLVSNGGSGPMLDLGEDGCLDDSLSSSWKKFDGELEEDSDNSADYAADSDECPV